MKEKFISSMINFLCKYNKYSDNEIKKLRYGLEGIYLTIAKTIVVFILAFILDILKEILLLLVFFGIIRYFSFGFHAEKSSECLILSIVNFIIIPFILLKIDISLLWYLIISGLCLLSFLIYAPADTPKRPLKDKKKRLIRKLLTLLIGVSYCVTIFIFSSHYISKIILCSLITTTIVISPITYLLFGQTYNNYRKN